MKKLMSIAAVTLFIIGLTGCCCPKSGKCCGNGDACCKAPAEKTAE